LDVLCKAIPKTGKAIPKTGKDTGVDTSVDVAKIARYMRKNMRTAPHHISTPLTTSRKFNLWANPVLRRVVERFPVDVYTAQRSILPFKACSSCRQLFPSSPVYFQRSGEDRYRSLCKLCQVYEDRYLTANKRARLAGVSGTVSRQEIIELFERARRGDKYLCAHTGDLIPASECCIDHVVPLSHGGLNVISNLCITSARINSKKGDKTINQWALKLHAMGIRVLPDEPVQKMLFTERMG
jgi:5-methylcytosine-specific restriction endonuclease McrA